MLGTYAQTGHAEHCPDINGPGCAAQPVASQWHDLKLLFSEVRLTANYAPLDWLSIDLMWSLRIVGIWFQLQDLGRRPIDAPYGEEIHHRTETLVGLSDPWLGLRFAGQGDRWSMAFRLGATLPVGATVENPFRLGREGKSHQHIQFGTGTVDPFAEISAQRQLGRFNLGAWFLTKTPLYRNRHGYQGGALMLGGLRAQSDLWLSRWQFTLGALAYHERPERWDGVIETEGNLGRTDLMLETAVTWRVAGPWSLLLNARFPVWSQIIGAQLTTPALFELSLARSFELSRRRPQGAR